MQIIGDLSAPHMPQDQVEVLRRCYAEAQTILEYGSGGSTAMAADMPGKAVFSVENDSAFVDLMALRLAGKPSEPLLHFEDLGTCGKWGRPLRAPSEAQIRAYASSVWERPDFRHPDVILIDGRCRAACFIAALSRVERPVTVLFDDWVGRPHYHWVAVYAALLDVVGGMAVLSLTPTFGYVESARDKAAFNDVR